MNEPRVKKDTRVDVLAQGREAKSGEWWTLGAGDREGRRTAWWAENITPGAYTEFRTVEHKVERIVTVTVLP